MMPYISGTYISCPLLYPTPLIPFPISSSYLGCTLEGASSTHYLQFVLRLLGSAWKRECRGRARGRGKGNGGALLSIVAYKWHIMCLAACPMSHAACQDMTILSTLVLVLLLLPLPLPLASHAHCCCCCVCTALEIFKR